MTALGKCLLVRGSGLSYSKRRNSGLFDRPAGRPLCTGLIMRCASVALQNDSWWSSYSFPCSNLGLISFETS
eukprot:1636297-Prymnesium_polylepis.1